MAVNKLLKRVEAATKAKSKELRLTLSESQELALQIGQLLANENKLLTKIIALQEANPSDILTADDLRKAVEEVTGQTVSLDGEVALDGGSF